MQATKTATIKAATLGSILLITSVLSGCGGAKANAEGKNKKNAEKEVIAIPVEVSQLRVGDISSNYNTTAILEAKEEAFVVPRAEGIIQEIFVEEGDYVEQGQVLAQLDATRYELSLARSTADLQGIEKELSKIDKVYNQKLVSDDTFDKLKAQYESAKATLELAKLDLKETTIVAPISGFIAEKNAKVGNLTESFQRQNMFHIVEQKELHGIVHLPEKELSKVHKEQQATLTLAALSEQKVSAFVERISPVIDPETGTFKVTLRVPNPDNLLKSGMFAQVDLNYSTHSNATLLPRRALINIDEQMNVFVVKDGKAEKVVVNVGYQEGEFVEVLNGLNGNETVIVTGHQSLKDQAPVEVVNS